MYNREDIKDILTAWHQGEFLQDEAVDRIDQLYPQPLDDKELEETLLDTKIFLHDDVAYFDGAYFRLGKKGVKQLVALLQKTRKRRKEREVLKGE